MVGSFGIDGPKRDLGDEGKECLATGLEILDSIASSSFGCTTSFCFGIHIVFAFTLVGLCGLWDSLHFYIKFRIVRTCLFEWTCSYLYCCGCLALCIFDLASKFMLVALEGVCGGVGDGGNVDKILDVGCWME